MFHQAIVQSGTVLAPWGFNKSPKEGAIKLAQYMGFNTTDENELYDFFMGQSATILVNAYADFQIKMVNLQKNIYRIQ